MPTVNIRAFSHKKSTVIENGGPKLPTAAQLELGEIAINFAKGYETLSIKNNNNEIVTFTNDNYWINKELAIAAALNDLNDRKQDALEMDEVPTEGSENVVTSGGLYSYITEIEQVTAAALNDLNDRITSLALSDDYAAAAQGTPPLAGDTYETAISKLHKVIVDDELITSSALNDLNDRIDNLSLSDDYEAADPASEPAGGDTYEEAISKLHGAILENELATAGALNDLNTRISDIVVPELILSEEYEPSSLSNEDLFLEPGDSYETAFAKLEKAINDNENITSAALTDLDSRLNLLHLPQSLDDIPDGSTRKLSDYATITSVNSSLATKQDTLVSGTNIKTINNESILGSGNITIQGGSGGDTNVIETIKINGTALTPDANKAVNIDLSSYDKAPLVIEVNDTDTTVPSGTYASITAALAEEREVVVKVTMTEDDEEIFYLNFVIDYSQADTNYYFNTVQYLSSYDFSIDVADQCSFNKHNIADAEHYHGNITNGGDITATAPTIANGDQLVINDHSASKITNGPTFDGSTTTTALTPKGTWETFLKTAPVTSVNGQTGAVSLSLGDTNVIETVKVNGTALTPDSNKAVDITVPTKIVTDSDTTYLIGNPAVVLYDGNHSYGNGGTITIDPSGSIDIESLNDLDLIVPTGKKVTYNSKEVATVDQIPSAVTESTVSGWGFTKNTGTYSKPSGGIPKTDLASAVQTSLGKADSAIQGVKVNGTALTPDSNKAVDITSIPVSIVTQDATHRFVSDTEKTTWNGKQNALQYYGESDGEAHVYIYDEHNSGSITLANLDVESAQPINQLFLGAGYATLEANFSGRTDPYGGHAHVKCDFGGIELKCTIDNETNDTVHLGPSTFTYNNKQVATTDQIPTKTSDLTNDSGFITSYTETDPTVPAWAKASTKPTYTAQEVGALPNTYTPPVTSVNGQTGAVNLTIPSAPGALNTTATTAQSTSSSEALSGNITLHKVAKTGTYNDLIGKPTIPTVNNATLTIQKNGTTVNTFTANASSNVTANIQVNELPTVSSSDNGKVLMVVNGAWSLVMPTSIYSGTSEPDSNTGNNGDLYLQTS